MTYKKAGEFAIRNVTTGMFFFTNPKGNGLWIGDTEGAWGWREWQILGTCDFTVRGVKDPIAKLVRYAKAYERDEI